MQRQRTAHTTNRPLWAVVGLIALALFGRILSGDGNGQVQSSPQQGRGAMVSIAASAESTAEPAPTAEPTPEPPTATSIALRHGLPPDAPPPSEPSALQPGVAPVSAHECPSGYPIKGTITSDGEHIYHPPGASAYTRTNPGRCFATDVDAVAEGFRRAQR